MSVRNDHAAGPRNVASHVKPQDLEPQARGQLTNRVQSKAVELLGRKITTRELRLMPYVAHCLQNDRHIDQQRVNDEERILLDNWYDVGWLEGPQYNLRVTHEFWIHMAEIIYLAYVDLRESV